MSNPWIRLRGLLPKDPLLVGTVEAYQAGGTSLVNMIGGGKALVRGQSVAIGKKAYVKAGEIVGEAPDLATVEIEI